MISKVIVVNRRATVKLSLRGTARSVTTKHDEAIGRLLRFARNDRGGG